MRHRKLLNSWSPACALPAYRRSEQSCSRDAEGLLRVVTGHLPFASQTRSGHHHVDLPATAPGTNQPLTPVEHGSVSAIASSHLGGVGLDLMPAFLAPDDQANLGRGGNAQRHGWAAIGLHLFTPRNPVPSDDTTSGICNLICV